VIDPVKEPERLPETLRKALQEGGLWVLIARRACLLAMARQQKAEVHG